MLAAMPGVPPQAQQRGAANVNVTSSPVLEDDRLCAGCNKSVSSDTGGVVVAFGNSLWHVDCFKCAKCGNQVNADTNLLLLSDGSPVCANCYNCKICKLPILDEAVMTGDDSFHAECFRCRSCKNRIDELVFAKTSQGFYCMKCHNERVARSRRHIAKQKQREREREREREKERERERAAPGSSSSGRSANAMAENGVMPRPKEGESVNAAPARPDSARTHDVPGGSSSDGQAQTSSQSQAMGSRGSYPTTSGGDAGTLGLGNGDAGLRSTSPAPPAVSVTEAGPSSEQQGVAEEHHLNSRQRANSHSEDNHHQINGISSDRRPSVDGQGLPPYAKSSPPVSGNSDVESARSSASFGCNASGTEPTSPSLSVSVSQEGASSSDQNHCAPANDERGSTTLAYLECTESGRDRSNSLTPRERPGDASGSGWPGVLEQEGRRKSHDDTRPSYLQPAVNGTSSLQVTKKREKRSSVNPGLQLEASKMLQYHNLQHPVTSPLGSPARSPASPTGSTPASAPAGTFGRTHSPTTVPGGRESPRVTSPLREYFTNSEDTDNDSGATTFYPPSPPPQQLRTIHSSTPRSAPVGARPSTAPTSTPGFGRFPQRSDSLQGTDSPSSSGSGHTRSHSRANGLPTSPYNGRLNAPTQLRSQRSFDERGGHLSPRNAEFGGEASGAKRSRSVSPHPPDVPRSIESGTDTETDNGNDSDSIMQSYLDRSDSTAQIHYPPAPPPKDPRTELVATPPAMDARGRSGSQPTSQPSSAGAADGDEYFVDKVEEEDVLQTNSAVTQRTSGFFIAPALPPMRFSMSGTDFNELFNNLGGSASAKRLSMIPGARTGQVEGSGSGGNGGNGNNKDGTIPEERSEDLDVDVATARTPTSLASTITPLPTDMTLSTSDNVASSANANSSINASGSAGGPTVIKPAERKASLRRKAPPPFEIAMYPSNERIAEASSSSATSPISPNNYNYEERVRSPRRSSKTDGSKVVVDEALGSPRSSAESRRPTTPKMYVNGVNGNGHGHRRSESTSKKQDAAELVNRRLKEALADATERQADYIKLDRAFVEAIVQSLDQKREQVTEISTKLDSMKRTSQMIFDGLSVAQDEYKQELTARQTAEEEVSRLKIEVSGQAARITALSSDERRRQVQKQLEKELTDSLSGLEQNLSKLKVERDMTLAEVEELSASKTSVPNGDGQGQGASIGRSLTMRLDNIKRQYQHDLVPLTQQREALMREIVDLKEARDIFLEETAVLNARNEELAQLNQQYERRFESGHSREKSLPPVQPAAGQSKTSIDKFDSWKARQGLGQGTAGSAAAQASPMVNTTSTSSSATLIEDVNEVRQQQQKTVAKPEVGDIPVRNRIGLRWPGGKANKDVSAFGGGLPAAMDNGNSGNGKVKKRIEHAFQQLSVLRFARCDLCGDKMWGSQVRCSTCNMSVHVRCVGQVQASCHDGSANGSDEHLAPVGPPPPSMFGRDLIEQVREDAKTAKNADLFVPIIVEKCINAVEANAMDYEGIYRKTGGSGQSKAITALFERGDYESFNLSDSDSFNDVSSVTSVLKNYFRMLPNPLLTFGMHEAFVAAGGIKDLQAKGQALRDLVKQLPAEHYHTLSRLMSHLHRIQLNAEVNLMNARNLGVIFGPTLMRSADPSREFADMAGKSLAIEYLIENAPSIFPSVSGSSGLTS